MTCEINCMYIEVGYLMLRSIVLRTYAAVFDRMMHQMNPEKLLGIKSSLTKGVLNSMEEGIGLRLSDENQKNKIRPGPA